MQALVEKAQGGDREAFARLAEDSRDRLQAFIQSRRRGSSRHDFEVDDVLQETFLRAFQAIGRFRWQARDSFLLWLEGIAGNVLLQLAGREKRRKLLSLERDVPAGDVSPGTAQRRRERFERLRASIGKLSPEHREAVILARIERIPIKEIAKRMNRTPDAVSHLLMRAVEKLRDSFGDTESLHLPHASLGEEVHDD